MPSSEKPPKQGKKNKTQLVIRIDEDLRQEFVDLCKDLDSSASRELRLYIKKFLKSHHKTKQ